ncbi:ESAT-6 protein secretion system EspG family protein [Herbihabitans rhizosphaerae]|uniref:ESAT-6 protein secretion system EspG family protein n=1 Tax=Herbihabitans rhizosphaerae TaxID=1872711 RepID=A0A4Q7L5Y2_9PSEU|nr:ESX secretion-associated protein EspG [Herbihabitans rhizosphaerae]RZS45069.1 ESAT-6 protein secretion system EspG family protein [Herbihabitans rhizosphaerae]
MRDPDSGWIQLDAVELSALWSTVDGDSPLVLDLPHVGRTERDREELAGWVSWRLRERDLGTLDQPARDLAGFLRTLSEFDVSLDLRVDGTGEPLAAIAADGRRGAAAAARVGDEIRIGPVTPGRLVAQLLDSLAPLPAGPGRPANVSAADFAEACQEGGRDGVSGFRQVLADAGLRQPEIATLGTALAGRTAVGKLGANNRGGRDGTVARLPGMITWVDTPEGRYTLRRNASWITVTPVDLPRLTAMAEELLADARS